MQCKLGIGTGHFSIGIEVACGVVGAAHHRHGQAGCTGCGQGTGAPHRRAMGARAKTEEIVLARRQACGIHLDRERRGRQGAHAAGSGQRGESSVRGHLPGQGDIVACTVVLRMRPQDHAIRQRITAGHPIVEVRHRVITATAGGQGSAITSRCGQGGQADHKVPT